MTVVGKPIMDYIYRRGRDELVCLTLALAEVDYVEIHRNIEFDADSNKSFSQNARYIDEHVVLAPGSSATRHLGRKHHLYGSNLQEQAYIDQVMDSVEDIRRKYTLLLHSYLMFGVELESAKNVYWRNVMEPATCSACGMGHFQQLALQLRGNKGGKGWAVGDRPSIADVLLFDIVDLHCGLYGEKVFSGVYPELLAFRERFAALPCIQAYLSTRATMRQQEGAAVTPGAGPLAALPWPEA